MKRILRRLIFIIIILGVAAGITAALWPRPVPVEAATVTRGPLRVTVDEDGRTRIKETYAVSAPLAGLLTRTPLKEGDPVAAGRTVLAVIEPSEPALLDPRERAAAEARVNAAQAAVQQTGANLAGAEAALELAQSELARVQEAIRAGSAVPQELERAQAALRMREAERRSAAFARDVAAFELELARAALSRGEPGAAGQTRQFEITAPVSGRVLRVIQKSAGAVPAGAPLIEVGDPTDLELVVDVLSRDGVAIRPGDAAVLEQWGGDAPLNGRVRLVEPAGFLKISALGVEEQRVNVIIDFVDPPEARAGLGDGFRIEARIVVWEQPDVLRVPTGALFRHADSWAVFAVRDGRARTTDITIGRRNGLEAQVLSGLGQGDTVVVYPSDAVHDNARVAPRPQ
ncbi:MAG: HlyD family efflux transporter periplasmic adaptor subunit [Phycisphaerales bacterium]|nr:HlyD family efflux transporter periplasmic adaptor subunit [Phycisphaerales bacterium]